MTTTKRGFKEKIVQMYESLFKSNDHEPMHDQPNYWNEFFLLKPNLSAIHSLIREIGDSNLPNYAHLVNLLFAQAVLTLGADNQIKELNGLLTAYGLSRAIFSRPKSKKLDPVDVLVGRRDLPLKLQVLNGKLRQLLAEDNSVAFKRIVLHFYLSLLTGDRPPTGHSTIPEQLMVDELFDCLIKLFCVPTLRQQLGPLTATLLTLFVHHPRPSPEVNLFSVKLSILDDEVALNGYAQIICASLLEFNRKFEQNNPEPGGGILTFLTSKMGRMFVRSESEPGDSGEPTDPPIAYDNQLLVAFYDIVHLSRNFVGLLTNAHADLPEEQYENSSVGPPSNLMVSFLEFCSIVMLYSKEKQRLDTARLCFVILNCVAEDQCANALMHDTNIAFKVNLHRLQMRHRKPGEPVANQAKPLAYSLLDLMCEFIASNMRKDFPLDQYLFAVNVLHRLLCYQKRCKIRYEYDWLHLWHTLISLLKYLLAQEESLLKRQLNLFQLANNVVNLLNLSITFGDTFLHSPNAYDELYYEIIRCYLVFNKLLAMAFKYSMVENLAPAAVQLLNSLSNIKSIISHFNAKIEAFRLANQSESLTEQEVMEIVRANYDTLTLKLQEGLDVFEAYNAEHPAERDFLRRQVLEPIHRQLEEQLQAHLDQLPRQQNELMTELLHGN